MICEFRRKKVEQLLIIGTLDDARTPRGCAVGGHIVSVLYFGKPNIENATVNSCPALIAFTNPLRDAQPVQTAIFVLGANIVPAEDRRGEPRGEDQQRCPEHLHCTHEATDLDFYALVGNKVVGEWTHLASPSSISICGLRTAVMLVKSGRRGN